MTEPLNEVTACGFLLMRRKPRHEFLLMEHPKRLDLPKGHLDPGESEMECALRELEEETGIREMDFKTVKGFRFETSYEVTYKKRFGGGKAIKTLVIFLGQLEREVRIATTEHQGHRWIAWAPPHSIQAKTIDPLLAYTEQFLDQQGLDE